MQHKSYLQGLVIERRQRVSCHTEQPCCHQPGKSITSLATAFTDNQQFYTDVYEIFNSVVVAVTGEADDFRKAFSPVKEDKDTTALKVIADILGIGFLVASHGLWHNVSLNMPIGVATAYNQHQFAKMSLGKSGKTWSDREAKNLGQEEYQKIMDQYQKSNPDRKSASEIAAEAKQAQEKAEKAWADDSSKRIAGYR